MSKNFAIKLAQSGYDVKTSGDENLIYSSNWPLLKIVKQGTFTTSDFQTRQTVYDHNLGYVPFFCYFANTNITGWNTATNMSIASRSEFLGPTGITPVITNKSLIFNGVTGAGYTGTIKFTYYIFALDITTFYQAPTIKVGGQSAVGRGGSVFKIAQPTKDISSSNLEDYTIHSDSRSPLIHQVFPGKTLADGSAPGYGFTTYHNLGYVPMFFAFSPVNSATFPANSWEPLFIAQIGTDGFTMTSDKLTYEDFSPGVQVSVVILKDPFNIDYTVKVSV